MKRRLLSAFLAVMMVLTMAPVAFAGNEDAGSSTAVAKIGDATYATLADAVVNAKTGDTIVMQSATDISTTGLSITSGKDITLDLNGYEVKAANTGAGNIKVYGKLTLKDSTDTSANGEGQGKITTVTKTYIRNQADQPIIYAVNGDFVMQSGLIDTATGITNNSNDGQFGVGVQNETANASVTIEGGKIKAGWYAVSGNGQMINHDGNITVNGGILESTADYAIYHPQAGTTTINGGVIYGHAGGIQINRGTLVVNNGTVTSKGIGSTGSWGDGTGGTNNAAIHANAKYGDVSVSIKDGKVTAEGNAVTIVQGTKHTATVAVSGGTFSSDVSAYCEKNYYTEKNADNTYTVKSMKDVAVAKIDDTYYKTLADAVAAAQSGETVKLLANINGQTVIPADKNIVLDLNGKTMTHTGTTLYNSGTLVVKDSSADKSGKIVSTGNVGIGVNHNSTTTIEYANIQAQEGAVITGYATGATITIEDGVFTALDNAVVAGNGNKTDKNTEGTPERVNANKITINGGTFTGNIQSSGYIACGIYAPWKDIITVNGGDFTVNNGIGIVARAGQVTVNGGRFICNGSAKGKVGDKKFDMDAAQILYFDASNPAYPAYNSATDYIKVTGGLFAAAFNNAYCADGKAVVPNTDAATKDVYPYTVGTVEENVEVSPAAPEAKAETTGKETTVADAMTSIAQNIQNNGATTEGLEAVGGQEANKVTTDEVTAAKTELAKTVSVADKTVTVYVQPYLDITVKDAKVSADNENAPYSVTLDIVPMVKKVASTAENADAIALSGNNKNAVVLENKEVTVTTPVTITIKLPDNFAISDVSTIKVKHEKNGVLVGYHDATVDKENRTVTFTNDKGFSTFTILSDSRSTSISFDGEAAVSYGPSNVNDALPTKTAPSGKVFKGWSFEGVNGTYTTLTDDLLTALDGKTAVKATSVFDNKSSGGSSGSSSGKTTYKVTTSAVNNGGVNASPSTAEKGATITLTLSPDKGYKLDKLTVTDGSGKSVSTVKKSDTVYTFTMPASAVKVGVSYVKATETPSETKFNDVSANDWFASAVDYVTGKGMMNGTADNTFSPKAHTTRGMVVTVLYRLENQPSTSAASFTDVASGAYYANAVAWANANGIVSGYGSGKFGPNDKVTREQLAAILYRYAQYKKYDVSGAKSLDGYTDAQSVSSYAVPALQWANAVGVVTGKSGNKLDPKGNATRAEVAAMLMRFCENVK